MESSYLIGQWRMYRFCQAYHFPICQLTIQALYIILIFLKPSSELSLDWPPAERSPGCKYVHHNMHKVLNTVQIMFPQMCIVMRHSLCSTAQPLGMLSVHSQQLTSERGCCLFIVSSSPSERGCCLFIVSSSPQRGDAVCS